MPKRMLTTGDVGRYCGVHFRTVSRWIAHGRLKGHRLPGGRGDYRVQLGDFLTFLRENHLPVPDDLRDTGRVLIVEHEPEVAHVIDDTLRRAGFETCIAAGGLQAGVLLQAFAPAVMTLDLNMPGTGGIELLRFLRAHTELRPVKVLVLSALGPRELRRAVTEGAADAMAKPIETTELVARVARLAGLEPGKHRRRHA